MSECLFVGIVNCWLAGITFRSTQWADNGMTERLNLAATNSRAGAKRYLVEVRHKVEP